MRLGFKLQQLHVALRSVDMLTALRLRCGAQLRCASGLAGWLCLLALWAFGSYWSAL